MKKYTTQLLFSALLLFPTQSLVSQENNFILSTQNFQPYFPTYIGNGHFSLSSTWLGTLPAESYMIKVYDQGKDDIPRIACLPEWNEINYHNGSKWLNNLKMSDSSGFRNYTQTLDMYNGLFETNYTWTADNRKTDIHTQSLISRKNPNIAVIQFELTTNFSDTITLSFPLKEREKPKRKPFAKLTTVDPNPPGKWPAEWYPGFMEVLSIFGKAAARGGQLHALSQSEGRNTKVALASEIFYEGTLPNSKISFRKSSDKWAGIEIKFIPSKGRRYTFYKIVSAVLGDGNDKEIIQQAMNISKTAKESGSNRLLEEHKKEWNNLWETDIIVEGNEEFSKIVHSMVYYLLCSIAEKTEFSIPPMGLATAGYYGHIFWDADTYMFPPLVFMHPEIAKCMVMFRYHALAKAKANAKLNKYKGAMYPWESDERGEETTPYFAYQNALKENHIVGDVALAQWQYFLATNDTNWLQEYGSKVITETAEFWTSRVHYNKENDRYEIGKVVSVSEGLIDISNETYTNSVAKLNLELAIKVSDILQSEKNPPWEEISKKMFIPYNKEEEYHPTYGNAPAGEGATELWSSVTPLLTFPLQMEMTDNAKRNNLLHAVRSLEKNGAGANMGINFLPVIAAELGNDSLFHVTINKTLRGYLRPPFNVLAETHTNNSINFITGAGAFLQQVIFGYTGLRLTEEGLVEKYKPMLPKGVKKLTLKNFTVRGKKYDIVVEKGNVEFFQK